MVFGLFEDRVTPTQQLPDLTPATLQATQEASDRALNSTREGETANVLAGVGNQSSTLLPSAEGVNQRNRSLGMLGPSSFGEAVSQRAKRGYDSDLNRLTRQAQLQSTEQVVQKQNLAALALSNKQAYDQEVYKRQMVQYQNEQAARNSAISSILGAAGAVGGALIGGPGGALAGGAIGGGLAGGNKQQQTL
jgi:hypothetical protein